jgi:hypothetical protein
MLVLAVACAVTVAAPADSPESLTGTALRAALQHGGFVLYFRHAATDFGQNDDKMTGYEYARARNLTDRGRADARRSALRFGGCTSRSRRCSRARSAARAKPPARVRRATTDARVRGGPAATDVWSATRR